MAWIQHRRPFWRRLVRGLGRPIGGFILLCFSVGFDVAAGYPLVALLDALTIGFLVWSTPTDFHWLGRPLVPPRELEPPPTGWRSSLVEPLIIRRSAWTRLVPLIAIGLGAAQVVVRRQVSIFSIFHMGDLIVFFPAMWGWPIALSYLAYLLPTRVRELRLHADGLRITIWKTQCDIPWTDLIDVSHAGDGDTILLHLKKGTALPEPIRGQLDWQGHLCLPVRTFTLDRDGLVELLRRHAAGGPDVLSEPPADPVADATVLRPAERSRSAA